MPELQVLIDRDRLREGVERVASEIRRDYRDLNPLLVSILKGSFVFLADLVRAIDIPLEVDFAKLSSYGCGMESSGRVRTLFRLSTPLAGRHVLVVEDIVDSGLTLDCFLRALRRRKPASLKLCALLDKPSRRQMPVSIDYLCFSIPNKFVVGYGIDFDEKYRYLPDICCVKEDCGEP